MSYVGPLCRIFPRLFQLVSTKLCGQRLLCWVGLGFFFFFRAGFRQYEMSLYVSLLSILSNVFICSDKIDIQIWKPCPSGVFTTRSFHILLEGSIRVKSPWLGCLVGLFSPTGVGWWLLERCPLQIILRRGLTSEEISDLCELCNKERESVDHVFLHCGVVASLPCLVRCPWFFLGLWLAWLKHGGGFPFLVVVLFFGG